MRHPHIVQELNRYIKGFKDSAKHPSDVMKAYFKRWPVWMWGNWEVAALTGWMREFNMKRPAQERVGFYGLDVYSLMESLEAIVKFMRSVDGDESIKSAERALACFERVATMGKEDVGQAYGMAAALTPYSCRNEVVKLLVKVREEAAKLSESPHDEEANENALSAELNTKVVLDAEKYYRIMVDGSDDSWNARDTHMHETLRRLSHFYGPKSKAIIWAHNTHNGDARATDMAMGGMHNIGQLARETWGKEQVHLVGLGTYQGSVMAGKRLCSKNASDIAP
ncbi:erythromycin esterase [Nannochloropsis gaditana CCMP526]|uniref:erythromycin esterase n=1 Tax=Nannochloropsis gaditana (strain CCMP526) TaxID=1093141 RepID=UPI00029F5261|nr:erythromycin esterase [Nannochloropsis gaditana CCMP526]EKU22672.1 erythromycin esterase [Nannochloropsis gaditana CCMP526]|eukprot:XP_005853691.1 erythromycin esterase [Nannochloropsis gaditana CCMP526]